MKFSDKLRRSPGAKLGLRRGYATRLASACLFLCLLCSCLSGCQLVYVTYDETPAAETTASTVETRDISVISDTEDTVKGTKYSELTTRYSEAQAAVSKLYPQDFSGYVYMTVMAEESSQTVTAEEDDALYYSYARRNSLITDYYKNSFYVRTAPLSQIKTELAASVKAGGDQSSYYADMLQLPALGAGAFAVSGLLMNLRQLPFYTVDTASCGFYGNKTYFDISSATESITGTYALYFNRELVGDAVTSKLYTAALNGGLSFEYLLTCTADFWAQGVHSFALGGDNSLIGEIALVRSGLSYTEKYEGNRVLSGTVKSADLLDSLISALLKAGVYTQKESTDSSSLLVSPSSVGITSSSVTGSSADISMSEDNTNLLSSYEMFASGKALFYIGTLEDIAELSEEKLMWGLLPLPANEDCLYNIEEKRSVFCVPANNSRLEMTGLMLTALGTAGEDWMGDEFLVTSAENHLRDNNSYYTLAGILEKHSFCDFAYLYGDSVKNLSTATYGVLASASEGGTSVASSAIPLEESVNAAIKKLK